MNALQQVVDTLSVDDRLTEALTGPHIRGRVSAVLATYNRCPVDPDLTVRDNPLTWALDTLLSQVGDVLEEIVVVDDASTDHTLRVLAGYEAGGGRVPVRVLRSERHQGAWAARNAALTAATAPLVLFGDDDCVFSPHYAAGAVYVLEQLRHRDSHAAAVHLPFYYRTLGPGEVVPATGIGLLRPELAEFGTWFHTWPDTHLPRPPLLDERSGLVAPLPVNLIGGTALIDGEALRRAGGFVNLSAWPTSYSDHLHLSADLTSSGSHLYHCPDPRLSAIHLKYGATGRYDVPQQVRDTVLPNLGRTLGELIDLSAQPRTDTGCRVTDDTFHTDMIGSFFAFFAGRSLAGGVRWGQRMWRDFVESGQVYSRAIATVPTPAERRNAWREGLTRGARWLTSKAARPGRTRAELDSVMDRISLAVSEDRISW